MQIMEAEIAISGPAPQSQAVREKDAEGSGSLVQISLLFFSWDIP